MYIPICLGKECIEGFEVLCRHGGGGEGEDLQKYMLWTVGSAVF